MPLDAFYVEFSFLLLIAFLEWRISRIRRDGTSEIGRRRRRRALLTFSCSRDRRRQSLLESHTLNILQQFVDVAITLISAVYDDLLEMGIKFHSYDHRFLFLCK